MIELVEIVSFDLAISSRLLKIANSSFYGQISKVDTIKRAVSMLGTKTVHDTVLTVSVSQAFRSLFSVYYDATSFWQNSVMRAVVAKSCAVELKIPEPDRLFALGLLSDIGHMVMSILAPDLMRKALSQHQKAAYPLYLDEALSLFPASQLKEAV